MRLDNGEVCFGWPLTQHVITAGWKYNSGALHRAIDLRALVGTPVFAAEDGTVRVVYHWNGRVTQGDTNSYGNMVKIEHTAYKGGKLETLYAHLNSITVKAGQKVKTGEVIGYSGQTGNCFGAHLHFEVRWKGVRENPLCWLDDDFKPASRGVILWANANQHSVQVDKQEAAEEPKVEPAVKKTVTKAITLNNGKWNVRKGAGMQYQSVGVISSPDAKTGKPVCIGYETVVNGWFKTVYGYISQKAVKSHT